METKLHSLCESHHFSPHFGLYTIDPIATIKLLPRTSKNGHRGSLKLGFRSISHLVACNSISGGSSSKSLMIEKEDKDGREGSVRLIYLPTPVNRELRTPHSGYHFDGTTRKFFEGWYFKVSIPERRQSFCFMYSVENSVFFKKLTALGVAQHGPRFKGVGAQILGADDKYMCQYSEESKDFWGSRHELMLGNTLIVKNNSRPPNKEVPPQEFNTRVLEGFQVTPLWHQGFIRDDGRSNYVETVKTARWEYSTCPVFGWGDVGSKQRPTAGVELEATIDDPGTTLRAPTAEAGLLEACKDMTEALIILDVASNMAAVEVGGDPRFHTWKGKTFTPKILNGIFGLPVDMEGFFNFVPLFKPPGL